MPGSTREAQNNRSLLTMCLELHMFNSGASDSYLYSLKGYMLDLNLLKKAIKDWELAAYFTLNFDEAVLNLIKVTVEECEDKVVRESLRTLEES